MVVHHTGGVGCLSPAIVIIVVLAVVMATAFGYCGMRRSMAGSQEITASTIKREPLAAGVVTETGYYTDELGWITDAAELERGMGNFYRRTGVQPYLYITDEVDGTHYPTDAQFDSFANSLYDALFEDEGHILVLFFEYDGQYAMWYVNGLAADAVMDSEAVDILFDYIEYYYYSDLNDTEMFATAFDRASERIMNVSVSPWVYVLIAAAVVAVAVVAYLWWKAAAKKKREQDEHTRRILETPLETFSDDDAENRAKKYETDGGGDGTTPPTAE